MKCLSRLKPFIILVLSLFLAACAGARPNILVPKYLPAPHKVHQPVQVALVLGAGGARGYAHVGVLKVLQQAGVPIDMIASASAGSIVGALYADSLNANRVYQIMMNAGFWDFAGISNLPSAKGPVEGYRVQKFLLRNMHARTFNQLKIPLIVATTNLKTNTTFPIQSGPVAPAVEASAAVPGVVQPPHLYGKTLVDGGVIDPIPVNLVEPYHPKVIIAVNIAQQLPKGMPSTALSIYDRSVMMSWLKLSHCTEKGAEIVIRPAVGDVGTFDLDNKRLLVEEGEVAAEKALPKILKLLKQKHIPLRSNGKV